MNTSFLLVNDEDNKLNGDNESDDNNSESFEDYSCPSFKPYEDNLNVPPINDQFLWILLWIIKF